MIKAREAVGLAENLEEDEAPAGPTSTETTLPEAAMAAEGQPTAEAAPAAPPQTPQQRLASVTRDLTQKLVMSRRYTQDAANKTARLFAAGIGQLALDMGMDPYEFTPGMAWRCGAAPTRGPRFGCC